MPSRRVRRSREQRGVTYLAVLVATALIGVGLLAASEVWVASARRQQLAQMEWVGQQYVQAIRAYYYSSPGSVAMYPRKPDDLIEDKRHLTMRRYLRELYTNPFTGKQDWVLVAAPDGGFAGIEGRVQTPEGESVRRYMFTPSR